MALTQSSSWFEQNAPDWARESATFIENIWNDGAYGLTYGEITIAVLIIFKSDKRLSLIIACQTSEYILC